jgi:2-polyprenyl-6-methoxyphenol hydroxylase-like FAD-dependent oxidoreductase
MGGRLDPGCRVRGGRNSAAGHAFVSGTLTMRVAIAGGSMAGLFAATLLRKAGHDVQVFERSHSGLEGRGAGLVAQQEVLTLLQAVDRENVASTGVVANARITLGRNGAILHRDPHPQMQLSWDHLYLAMRELVGCDCYRIGRAAKSAGQDADGAWLILEDGTRVDADIVIGADGIGSAVRKAVVDATEDAVYAGYVAWRALIPEAQLPPIAAEALLERFAFYHMKGGQVLGYLVAGPAGEIAPGARRYNCVWYRRTDDLIETLRDKSGRTHRFSLSPGAVSAAAVENLKMDAQKLLPPAFAAVITAEPHPFVQAIFDMEASRMAHDRIALIGDSAFIARPHTAMGVAKAAGDALALAQAVAQGWSDRARLVFDRDRVAAGQAIAAYGRRLGATLH